MSFEQNKYRFIKILIELLVEEKAYVVEVLKYEHILKQCILWHSNRFQEHPLLDGMTLTPSEINFRFFINSLAIVPYNRPFDNYIPHIDAPISMNANPIMNAKYKKLTYLTSTI